MPFSFIVPAYRSSRGHRGKSSSSLCIPYWFFRKHSGYTEFFLNLRDMIFTELFKGQACPWPSSRIVNCIAPVMFILAVVILYIAVIKRCVIVRQLIKGIFLLFAIEIRHPYKAGRLKIADHFRKISVCRQACLLYEFISCKSVQIKTFCQDLDRFRSCLLWAPENTFWIPVSKYLISGKLRAAFPRQSIHTLEWSFVFNKWVYKQPVQTPSDGACTGCSDPYRKTHWTWKCNIKAHLPRSL